MESVTLADVERQIAGGFRLLRFTPAIEALFTRDYAAHRVGLTPIWALVGTLIYDLAHFGDISMMADVSQRLFLARFAVFTPFALFTVIALRLWPSARNYDLLAIAIGTLGALLPMSVGAGSASPYFFAYQTGSVATFLFFVVALRPRFPAVLVGLFMLCTIQFATTGLSGAFDPVTYAGIVTFYLTLTVFLGMSAYFAEHKERLNFIHQLRGCLLQAELQRQSERDELTGLLNRRSLARIHDRIWRESGHDTQAAVILLDIDHFKRFNDIHGHIEGDECIRAVSRCISRAVGSKGHTFRYGGEEILILLPGTQAEAAVAMAQAIRAAIEILAIPHHGLEGSGHVTASLGVASGRPAASSFAQLLADADVALYEAKRQGRNRVRRHATPESPAPAIAGISS